MAFWLRRAPAPPDLGELAASPNRDVCRWEVWIGFEAVERLTVRYGTARSSTVQHGARSMELLSLFPFLPIQEAARARLSPLASHLSSLISHLSPLTSRSSVKRRPRPAPSVTPQNVPLPSPLLSPFPSIFSTSRSRATHNLLRCSFEIPQYTMVHPRAIILKALADFHGGGDGGHRKQNCPA